MKKAGKHLQKSLFPRMVHVTCLTHALHNLCDFIRIQFPRADALVNENKKIFRKSAQRKEQLEEKYPDLSVPPFPVLTRWGTWLNAIKYYAIEWNRIKDVVENLDNDSAAIIAAKKLYNEKNVFIEISFVYKHYVFLAETITQLEGNQVPISSALHHLNTVILKIKETPNQDIKDKFDQILKKNVGLPIMEAVVKNDIDILHKTEQFKSATPADISRYNFAPLVSCDVERSFSKYKSILTDHRRSFNLLNLRYHLIIACNTDEVESSKNENLTDNSDDE